MPPSRLSDIEYMLIALEEARAAEARGEVPVGAVVVDAKGNPLAAEGNRSIEYNDPAGHAEMLALRNAGQSAGNYRLTGATLYVTLEPCIMCAGAMVHARIGRIVYGAADTKAGALESVYRIGGDGLLNHGFAITGGVLADQCGALLKDFFRKRR